MPDLMWWLFDVNYNQQRVENVNMRGMRVCVTFNENLKQHEEKKILQINILSAMLLPLNVNTANHVALNRNKALNSQQPKEEEEKE